MTFTIIRERRTLSIFSQFIDVAVVSSSIVGSCNFFVIIAVAVEQSDIVYIITTAVVVLAVMT